MSSSHDVDVSAVEHVLAIDTALGTTGVTYLNKATMQAVTKTREDERGQAQFLVPMMQDVVKEAGIEFADLDAVVSTVGPGSFTGLRIGLASARSLAAALEIPVIGIATVDLIAHQALKLLDQEKINSTIHVVLETKREDFYYRYYNFSKQIYGEMAALPCDQIISELIDKDDVLAGNATLRFCDVAEGSLPFLSENIHKIQQSDTELLAHMINQTDWHISSRPLYLRGADVSQSKRKNRVMV